MSIVKEKGNIDPKRRRRNERGLSLEREIFENQEIQN